MKHEKIVKTIIIPLGAISFLIIYNLIYFIRENINSTVTILLLLSTAGFAIIGIIYLLETKRVKTENTDNESKRVDDL
jgi:archaellum biogenesis protein FlaJ (TadC family)